MHARNEVQIKTFYQGKQKHLKRRSIDFTSRSLKRYFNLSDHDVMLLLTFEFGFQFWHRHEFSGAQFLTPCF